MADIEMIHGNCLDEIQLIKDESIDVIFTDPPYLYLKNQKLEKKFDEIGLFSEWKRVLKKNGFIVIFGRGESFYRWNYLLFTLGFSFKEEIIWDKGQCSSPLMSLSRVHETVAIWTKGKGVLNKVKVPYLEMKKHDLNSIIGDIKRMKVILKNTKSLDAVLAFLENNNLGFEENHSTKFKIQVEGHTKDRDRTINTINSIQNGMNEKTIIRTDRQANDKFTKFSVNADERKSGDRAANVAQSIQVGMNEKSIIKETRPHYTAIHPTEKPTQLIQRLLKLVSKKGDLVLDCFGGSFSTGEACFLMDLNCKIIELDKEYFDNGKQRIEQLKKDNVQLNLDFR